MAVTEFMSEEQRRSMKYLSALEFIRREKPDMSVYMLTMLLHTKKKPGIALKDMEAVLGLPASVVARNIQTLSSAGYIKPDKTRSVGLDLVETYTDAVDSRVKRARLTKKGEAMMKEFDRIMRG